MFISSPFYSSIFQRNLLQCGKYLHLKYLKSNKIYIDENGQFSRDVYEAALRDMQLNKAEFEEDVRNILILRKVLNLMNAGGAQSIPLLKATLLERNALEMAHNVSDRLMIKTIPLSQMQVSFDDEELRTFWEMNADNWKTPMEFEIEYILIPFSEQKPEQESKWRNPVPF